MLKKIPMMLIFILLIFQFLVIYNLYCNIKEIRLNESETEVIKCTCEEKINIETESISEELNNTYSSQQITHSENDINMLAKLVWIEARGESDLGQQAVVEVVINRVNHSAFPNTIKDVIFQPRQFTHAQMIYSVIATEKEYANVKKVLNNETDILNNNVVYFSTTPQNNKIFKIIGNHYFNEY